MAIYQPPGQGSPAWCSAIFRPGDRWSRYLSVHFPERVHHPPSGTSLLRQWMLKRGPSGQRKNLSSPEAPVRTRSNTPVWCWAFRKSDRYWSWRAESGYPWRTLQHVYQTRHVFPADRSTPFIFRYRGHPVSREWMSALHQPFSQEISVPVWRYSLSLSGKRVEMICLINKLLTFFTFSADAE